LIEVSTSDGAATGLLHDSAVRCERLHTIPQADVRLIQALDRCLKAALGIR
jgi:hypothetical protein